MTTEKDAIKTEGGEDVSENKQTLDTGDDKETKSTPGQGDDVSSTLSPRDQMMESMVDRHEQNTVEQIMESGGTVETLTDDDDEELPNEEAQLHEEQPSVDVALNDDKRYDDVLSDYVTIVDGEPMMKLVVDGEEQLMPLQKAHQQIQKVTGVENRFDQLSQWEKDLAGREATLAEQSAQQEKDTTFAPPSSDVGDHEEVRGLAASIVDDIVAGNPDDAVEKLAEALVSRIPEGASVDPEKIAEDAARLLRESQERERQEQQEADDAKAMADGFTAFSEEYSDIVADPKLYAVANSLSTEIAEEHRDWSPTQVLLEAGKQTREWVAQTLSADDDDETGKDEPGQNQETVVIPDENDRQSRKDDLVPMPSTATATQERQPEEQAQTPQDIVNEMRETRGQAG